MTRQLVEAWEGAQGRVTLWWEADRRRYVVERFVARAPKRRTFAVRRHGTQTAARRSARVYAEELVAARARVVVDRPATLDQLWARYEDAMGGGWRAATRTNLVGKWRLFTAWAKPGTDPELITSDDLDRLHKALRRRERPMATTQVRAIFALIRSVYRMAGIRRWCQNIDAATYTPRISRDEALASRVMPAEYTPEEWRAILGALNPRTPEHWRCWVQLAVEGLQGHRFRAVQHLRWQDVDLAAGVIRWPAEYQKQGVAITQPLLPQTRAVLEVAAAWRAADGYDGPWILYRRRQRTESTDRPVPYQTIHYPLQQAEKRAGVPHRPYRATHGARKMSGENVYGLTGDLLTAAEWLGDRDIKQMRSYLQRGAERMANAAAALGSSAVPDAVPGARMAEEGVPQTRTGSGVQESHWSDLNRRPLLLNESEIPQKPARSKARGESSRTHETRNNPKSDRDVVPDVVPDTRKR